jgi:hypothetical protein
VKRTGTRLRLTAIVVVGLALGGCSVIGSLHLGDVTLGLQDGLVMGSHVGIFVH